MFAAILTFALGMTAAPASQPLTGKWGVDYSPTQCLMTRAFGEGPVRSVLVMDASPISGRGDVSLLLPPSMASGIAGHAIITAMPSGTVAKTAWYKLRDTPERTAIRLELDDTSDWNQFDTAESLSITGIGNTPIVVPLDGLDKATSAAKTCGRALMKSWGADPEALVKQTDCRNLDHWFEVNDYPQDALRAR